MLLISL